ncbi:MAG TPA: hypothetical protein VIX80_08735 [Candidatus Kapabacteria bacterium]
MPDIRILPIFCSLLLSSCTLIGTGVGLNEAAKGYGYGVDISTSKYGFITIDKVDSNIVTGFYSGDTLLSEMEYRNMYNDFLRSHPQALFPTFGSKIEYQKRDWSRHQTVFKGFGYHGFATENGYVPYRTIRFFKNDSLYFEDYDFEVIRTDRTIPLISGFIIKDSTRSTVVWNNDIKDFRIEGWVGSRAVTGTAIGLLVDAVLVFIYFSNFSVH